GFEGQAGSPSQFAGCTVASVSSCPTGISFNGGNLLSFGFQNNLPQDRLANNTQYQDNLSWVHGRHTFKVGAEYGRQRSPNNFLPNINGTFTVSSFNNLLRDLPSRASLAQGILTKN